MASERAFIIISLGSPGDFWLGGDRPIRVPATARLKIDGKDYPMAFVQNYGRGRVFHTILSHDVQAVNTPGLGELLRRASFWTAGQTP